MQLAQFAGATVSQFLPTMAPPFGMVLQLNKGAASVLLLRAKLEGFASTAAQTDADLSRRRRLRRVGACQRARQQLPIRPCA